MAARKITDEQKALQQSVVEAFQAYEKASAALKRTHPDGTGSIAKDREIVGPSWIVYVIALNALGAKYPRAVKRDYRDKFLREAGCVI